jgi:hypothetical protein
VVISSRDEGVVICGVLGTGLRTCSFACKCAIRSGGTSGAAAVSFPGLVGSEYLARRVLVVGGIRTVIDLVVFAVINSHGCHGS